jgi:hypothetical protein
MDAYNNAQEWNPAMCPSTFKTAGPRDTAEVNNVTVIKAGKGGACYRNATFSGVFAVADVSKLPSVKVGKHRVPVFCLWFRHRLKEKMPRFEFDMSKCEIDHNYSGKVDSNLDR